MSNRNLIEIEMSPSTRALDKLWQRIGKTASTDIMDRADWVALPQGPAGIDHLLGTPLHFGIAALYGIKIEFAGIGAGSHA